MNPKDTPQFRQCRQIRVMNAMYRCRPGSARLAKVRAMYDTLVELLVADLGADARCIDVDRDLANTFSDWYKEVNGTRPTFHLPRAEVQAWIAHQSSPEMVALRNKQ